MLTVFNSEAFVGVCFYAFLNSHIFDFCFHVNFVEDEMTLTSSSDKTCYKYNFNGGKRKSSQGKKKQKTKFSWILIRQGPSKETQPLASVRATLSASI